MKVKKILLSIITIAIFSICTFGQSTTYAAKSVTSRKFKVIPYMTSNFGYAIGEPGANAGSPQRVAATIWNIVEQTGTSGAYKNDEDIFCLREGLGFANTNDTADYDYVYDMKEEKSAILSDVYNWNTSIDGKNQYSTILAALDLFYIKGQSSSEYRAQLLKAAGIHDGEYLKKAEITDADIKAVEQAVLWYFTNYGENSGLYDNTSKTSWLNYTTDGSSYTSLSDYNPEPEETTQKGLNSYGKQRQEQAEKIYKYLITTAKANASKYDNISNQTTAPATIDKSREIDYQESGDKYIIGPFKITETANNTIEYTTQISVKNGSSDVNYTLLNANKGSLSSIKSGEDFYLSISKSNINIESLKINIAIKYSQTTIKLWTKSGNQHNQQPVVIPEKENKTISEDFTVKTKPVEKQFDLALRKYITKINDTPVSVSREPVIDYSPLNTGSGTTAAYKHRKDAQTVKNGDKVTYKLTIYNEGEKSGRATKVIDQLPTGLTFKRIVSGKFVGDTSKGENGYDAQNNKLYLVRQSGNQDNLSAYVKGSNSISSETIEIECEVTATPDTGKEKILTNVAWIEEEYDAEAQETITSVKGKDRDSEPTNSPASELSLTKDNMDSYKGNSNNKSDLTDSTFHYAGRQDDDDFEKLKILPETPGKFDLALMKRIVAVNDEPVPNRIVDEDVSNLNTSDGTTTGDYEYKKEKEPVAVKKGDIVTYTFRIYNEGTVDGYAKEITEDVPEGLEFVWSSKTGDELANDENLTEAEKSAIEFNQKYLWGKFVYDNENEDKIIQISTDYLSKEKEKTPGDNLIKAFGDNDGSKTMENMDYKEVSVKFKVVSDDTSGNLIRNEAWISDDSDKDGKPVDDRDSDPEDSDNHPDHEDDEDHDYIVLQTFDLALRKFIVAVSDDETVEEDDYLKANGLYQRGPDVKTDKLNTVDENGDMITTADYNHTKQPVRVKVGDYVVYEIRVYNEGTIDGYADKITDWLPPYLEFVDCEFNRQYGWEPLNVAQVEDGTYKHPVATDYLSSEDNLIKKPQTLSNGELELSSKSVQIMCRVTDEAIPNENITNIAEITEFSDENKQPVEDRDSQESNMERPQKEDLPNYKGKDTNPDDLDNPNYHYEGQQDDDDFEKVVVQQEVDLALRKFIAAVSSDTNIEESEYLKTEDGKYQREPQVDTSKLNTLDENGNMITTAEYNHPKTPVKIAPNSVVVYMLRVYNEGDVDAYAGEIKDHLPPYLEFVEGEFNDQYGWKVSEDGRTVTTRYLENTKLSKIKTDESGKIEVPDSADVPIMCRVKENAKTGENITNIADIAEYLDENKNPTDDRDSEEDNLVPPEDDKLPDYKGDEKGDYIPGNEDDDDFEKVVIETFDLALRKFIVAVSNDTTIEDSEYLKADDGTYKREPQVDVSKLNTLDENGNLITTAEYNHPKDPVLVQPNDIVIYVLRVYNEGNVDGFAGEIKDYLPPNLEFVEGEFNDGYGWEVSEDGRTVTTRYLENTKLSKIETDESGALQQPDYADVQIMCRVKQNAKTDENITNLAEIAEYLDEDKEPVIDRDSQEDNLDVPDDDKLPGYKEDQTGSYIPGDQDDDDFEKVVIKEFDLALRKWVTQAIVIDKDGQKVTETGHQPYDDPEQVVKVELHRKKLDEVVVKFRYSIRVINEGDIAGYAKEVTDYIPDGLKFVAEDNPGWTDEGNNVISTRLLENTLLQPGEYADVEVVLTWVNNQNNLGTKINVAEISEDYNEYGVPDKDSTPDNQKQGEDDIDDAPVMLSISTGQMRIYFTLGFSILITIASGVVLIKKFVL